MKANGRLSEMNHINTIFHNKIANCKEGFDSSLERVVEQKVTNLRLITRIFLSPTENRGISKKIQEKRVIDFGFTKILHQW
jgi:hypothetical protein